jgi:hypothetical protein
MAATAMFGNHWHRQTNLFKFCCFTFFKTFLSLSYYSFHAINFLLILVPCTVHALTWNFMLSWQWLWRNNKLSSGTWKPVFGHYLPFRSNTLKIFLSSASYHLNHNESEFQNTLRNTYAKITYASTYTNTYSLILQTLALSYQISDRRSGDTQQTQTALASLGILITSGH